MSHILVIDDEKNIRSSLKSALEKRNCTVITAATIAEATMSLETDIDIIFLDIQLPDGNGLDLLKKILSKKPSQTVVMISGHADIDTAVEAIKIGAYDFIEKPISLDRILITIENASKTTNLKKDNERLTSIIYGDFIGQSEIIESIKQNIIKSASKTTKFLILGENGTGKELAAHMIHQYSNYSEGPFIAVNCAALPSELVESELFGHTVGAFTGAAKARKGKFIEANQGTIFLDEISEMPPDAQAKILRSIETKTISPVGSDKTFNFEGNIIAASNRDLNKMSDDGKFRKDLLYRLNVVQFVMPPLKERKDDIPLLIDFFLEKFAFETKTNKKSISQAVLDIFSSFDYPGNIRQLKNIIERINIYVDSDDINPEDIAELIPISFDSKKRSLKEAMIDFEDKFITSAITKNKGNISQAARELGIERSHLYKKLKKHDAQN